MYKIRANTIFKTIELFMKFKLIFLAIIAFTIVACNSEVKGKNGVVYKNAEQYNDYIIKRQTNIINAIMDIVKAADIDVDSAEMILNNAVREIDEALNKIEGMPAYKGDSALRDAAISLFRFYKDVFGNDYKQLLDIRRKGENMTAEGGTEMQEIVDRMSKKEEKYDRDFRKAQLEFAKNNNLKLTENEMQKKIDEVNN